MSTYADLQAQVASDLKRSDLTTDIQTAILAAIRDHGAERFWFNETRSYTLALSSGTSGYSLASSGSVQEFVRIDMVSCSAGSPYQTVDYIDFDEMESLHNATTGSSVLPSYYNRYADEVRFYPTPSTTASVRIAGHVRLTELASGSSANAWTNAAKDLIRYSALKRLYAYPIRNLEQAQAATAAETLELEYLRRETDRRRRTGQMRGYY